MTQNAEKGGLLKGGNDLNAHELERCSVIRNKDLSFNQISFAPLTAHVCIQTRLSTGLSADRRPASANQGVAIFARSLSDLVVTKLAKVALRCLFLLLAASKHK